MITAIVLLCSSTQCYHSTYQFFLETEEECRQLIELHNYEGVFNTTIDNELYTLSDYMCINWNAQRI